MKKVLAIITARGGSKSLPGKNIKMLAGKPLIAWTIEAALKSKYLDRVLVSTDDKNIAAIAKKYHAEAPFLRPANLATDKTPTVPVLLHALRWLRSNEGYRPDVVVTLQPTSPLRQSGPIDEAMRLFTKTGANSVVSVCPAEHSPYWMMKIKRDRVSPFMKDYFEHKRRQDLPPVYRPNGAIYITRYDVLTKEKRILGRDTRAIVMDARSSVDIDTSMDFKLAESILHAKRAHR